MIGQLARPPDSFKSPPKVDDDCSWEYGLPARDYQPVQFSGEESASPAMDVPLLSST
jgi:hypothetical protein